MLHVSACVKSTRWCYGLEHKLITNREGFNVIRAIRLDRVHDHVALAYVRRARVGCDGIDTQINGNINFRLFNCLELRTRQRMLKG